MIKSLTLSIDDIRQLIEIDNPDHRRQVLQSLTDNAANPPIEVDPQTYSDAHPMAMRLAQKIQRKARAATLRNQKKQQQKSVATPDHRPQSDQAKPCESISIELNEATIRRLLWLKQSHKQWLRAINCIVEAITGSQIPRQIYDQLQPLLSRLFSYIKPLIQSASDSLRTPRLFRPRVAVVQPTVSPVSE